MKSALTPSNSFFDGLEYYRSLDSGFDGSDCYVVYGGDEDQDRARGKLRGWKTLIDPAAFGL